MMDNLTTDLMTLLPEIIVLAMAMSILLISLFLKPKQKIINYILAQIS